MRFPSPPLKGRLIRRYKRFLADIELEDGSTLTAHCPNTGSLLGCKEPGSPVWLRDSGNPKRKYRHTWQAVQVGKVWVNIDTSLPNRIVSEALEEGQVEGLARFERLRNEVNYGDRSRIDILLEGIAGVRCYIEVKNTTLAEGRVAAFPDAVTARGLKHLKELERVVQAGDRAVQFFLVSRDDVDSLRPADEIDPAYAEGLRSAAAAGVEIRAWTARVRSTALTLEREIEVLL